MVHKNCPYKSFYWPLYYWVKGVSSQYFESLYHLTTLPSLEHVITELKKHCFLLNFFHIYSLSSSQESFTGSFPYPTSECLPFSIHPSKFTLVSWLQNPPWPSDSHFVSPAGLAFPISRWLYRILSGVTKLTSSKLFSCYFPDTPDSPAVLHAHRCCCSCRKSRSCPWYPSLMQTLLFASVINTNTSKFPIYPLYDLFSQLPWLFLVPHEYFLPWVIIIVSFLVFLLQTLAHLSLYPITKVACLCISSCYVSA